MKTSVYFFFIHYPVSKRAVITVSFSEPPIIHHQHLNSEFGRFTCNVQKFLIIKFKIRCFPVVDQDWAFPVQVRTANQVIPIQIMVCPRHLSKTFPRIDKNHFRSRKTLLRFQFPRKSFRMNPHHHTHRIKLTFFRLCNKISGIHKIHCINFSHILIRFWSYQSHERTFLMT